MKNEQEDFFKPEKSGITPKQQRAIESLLAGCNKSEAAQAAGVSTRTLRYWFADSTFRAALTRATDQALTDATHRLAGSLDTAIAVLNEIMFNKDAKDPDRLRAAGLIIRRSLDLVQQKELLDRVANLEEILTIDD